MADRFSQGNQYLSISTPLGTDKLILRSLRGEESLSSLFHYRVSMIADSDAIDFDQLIGKAVTITITLGNGSSKRYINAIVASIALTHVDERDNVAHYEADLRPWLWMLTHSGDCRIFQNLSVPDIVEKVCGGAGYTTIRKSLNSTHAAREYCVQYRETDHNFVSRLLEEEGIFYFFEHANGKHTLVLGDGSQAFAKNTLVSSYDYRGHGADDQEDDVLTALSLERRVTTKSYGVDSFNFETPSTDLYSKADGSAGTGTMNDYAVVHTKSDQGEAIAKLRQQALAFTGKRLRGGGACRALQTGTKMTIAGHSNSALNGELVIYGTRIEATTNQFSATFTGFPSSVLFRPVGTATKPRIHSTQTALVVGKSGEEIWLDKYGRIKVQFHWDRLGKKNESSSCWVRVAQNWAGKNYGIMFFPRIGQEVVVTFLDGDPDQPLVTGSVYNAEQTVPYGQPANSTKSTIKTQTSKNGTGKNNEIRFEDKADAEEIYVHAQKDMNVTVENDVTRTIKHDEKDTVTNDSTIDIQHDRKLTVKNDHTITVSEGNETHKVSKGTRAVTVAGKETHTNQDAFEQKVTKDYKLTVSGNLTIDVTGDVTIKGKSVSISSTSSTVTVKSATGLTAQSGTTFDAKSGTAMTIKSGAALTQQSTMATTIKSSMGIDIKASLALSAQGLTATFKGSTMGTVDGGPMLTVKGALVKIN